MALSARLCYSAHEIAALEDISAADQGRLIARVLDMGHESVLEHAVFTFGIEGVSRALSHQLVRHRIASFSQQSQRYVSSLPATPAGQAGGERFAYRIPATIAADIDLAACYRRLMDDIAACYRRLLEAGVPPEDARFVLPNATETRLVATMNARELRHFFRLRCCRRAQWEIRELAVEMLRQAKACAPLLFKNAGPACLTGPCPEGRMSCGCQDEVRREFAALDQDG